jgi:hypothetical protein
MPRMWIFEARNRLRACFAGGRNSLVKRRIALRLEALESRTVLAFSNIWTGAAGDSSWFTAGNWSSGQVPSFDDTVEIPAGNVIIPTDTDSSATASSVTVDGGHLDVQGFLDLSAFAQVRGVTQVEASGEIFAFQSFAQTGGRVELEGGSIRSTSVNLSGGLFVGFGTLSARLETPGTVLNRGGTLSVTGPLFIGSNYRQTATGTLIIATDDSVSSAPLQIEDDATLAGKLDIVIASGADGIYPLITYGKQSGTFAPVARSLPAGYTLSSLDYGAGELDATLAALPPPPPPPPVVVVPPPPTVVVPPPPTVPQPVVPQFPDPLVLTLLTQGPTKTYTPAVAPAALGTTTASSTARGYGLLPTLVPGFALGNRIPPLGVVADSLVIDRWDEPPELLGPKRSALANPGHGFEVYEVDRVLAEDLDRILRVQMGAYAVPFERDILSGTSIVRALLTGTTPRTDLLPQGSHVASVATLVLKTDVHTLSGTQSESTDGLDLPTYLIDPVQGHGNPLPPVVSPTPCPISQVPSEASSTRPGLWMIAMVIGAAAGAFQVSARSNRSSNALESKP